MADVDAGDQARPARELAGHVDDPQVPAAVARDEEGDVGRARGLVVDRDLAEGLEIERLFGGAAAGRARVRASRLAANIVFIRDHGPSLCTNPAPGRSPGEDPVGDRAVVLADDVPPGPDQQVGEAVRQPGAEAVLLLRP